MKKIIKILLIIGILFGISAPAVFAGDEPTNADDGFTNVYVTEKILGAECSSGTKEVSTLKFTESTCEPGAYVKGNSGPSCVYECKIKQGLGTLYDTLSSIIKAFTIIAALAGVLFIIINGILISMSGGDSGAKDNAKKKITKAMIGLILLFLSGIILNIIAPWVYK